MDTSFQYCNQFSKLVTYQKSVFLAQIVIILIVFVLLGAALAYLTVNTGFECSLGILVSISSTGELGFYEHCMI